MKFVYLVIIFILSTSGSYAQRTTEAGDVAEFTKGVFRITEVMFHDVVNPPAAARFYAYSMLAAHQVRLDNDSGQVALSSILKQYPDIHINVDKRKIYPAFCSIYAMLETAKNIIPSGYSLQEKQDALYKDYLKAGVKKEILDSSRVYAEKVSKAVVTYSKSDGYFKLSTLQRYQPGETDSTWYPTPPEYMGAVEPNWRTMRTFFLDSAQQFKPVQPVPFNVHAGTPFFKLMEEVHNVGINLTDEQKLIARYWDCNPFANFYSGHVSVGIKKISPGGHWMSITGIACKKAKLTFAKTLQVHALIAMAMHDGFVSCWDEKYRSHRIRPKTSINRYIDEKWNPILETPPFPEYTSGHSVISTLCAGILTHLIGDNFEFVDNTEVLFGFSERKFKSFRSAANEAAISRLFGGIHYRDAIENGQLQGEQISNFIITKYFAGGSMRDD